VAIHITCHPDKIENSEICQDSFSNQHCFWPSIFSDNHFSANVAFQKDELLMFFVIGTIHRLSKRHYRISLSSLVFASQGTSLERVSYQDDMSFAPASVTFGGRISIPPSNPLHCCHIAPVRLLAELLQRPLEYAIQVYFRPFFNTQRLHYSSVDLTDIIRLAFANQRD
jgi:hypothetical protein